MKYFKNVYASYLLEFYKVEVLFKGFIITLKYIFLLQRQNKVFLFPV